MRRRRGGSGRGAAAVGAAVVAALIAAPAAAPAAPAPPARPNLLLITADDLNADSPGWMGHPTSETPRLDVLAAASHRFVHAHVTAPICQPSRAALMTGRVPHRNGALGFDPVADDVPTLVEVLRAAGWFTAALNKLEHMQPRRKLPWDFARGGTGRQPDAVRRGVARALAAARRAGQPFFLNVNLEDPHRPWRRAPAHPAAALRTRAAPVPGFLEDLPRVRRDLGRYLASVARLDASLGAVLDVLDRAGHGGDTIVVLLSDNGMSAPFAKATVYRHGTWSPVLLRYPGMPPPATHDAMVSSVDLMPTLLDLAGVPPPPGLDGRSWVPLLRGEPQPERDAVVTHVNTVRSGAPFPQRCIRTRTSALLFHAWADGRTRFRGEPTRGGSFRALARAARSDEAVAARLAQYEYGAPLAFYDLARDPGERANLIDAPARRADIETLQARLLAHMERTGDPQTGAFRTAVAAWRTRAPRPAGRDLR